MTSPHTTEELVVLVPSARGARVLAGIGGVRPLMYRPGPELPAGAEAASLLVAQGIDPAASASLFAELPRLKMVQLVSSGTDRWEAHIPPGVRLSNLTGVHGPAVAEWVVAQLLSHFRQLDSIRKDHQAQRWNQRQTGTLSGKRVVVLGAGDIGQHTARILEPFGVQVSLVATSNRPGVTALPASDALLAEADVVVLAMPLTNRTRHLVDAGFLARLKQNAVLINVGRGELIDTDALLDEVERQRLWAILDVIDPEPLPPGHQLWTAPQVLISSHLSAMTDDMEERTWQGIARLVQEFVAQSRVVSRTHGMPSA